MIYLDNAATTRPCAAAVQAAVDALTVHWANPSALYHEGVEAARLLRACREQVAQTLGAPAERVVFTSGGTESDNWAILSAVRRSRKHHIITTQVEHHAVLHPIELLEQQGYRVTYLKPDALGRVGVEALRDALTEDTCLVSIMMVNNETGAVMPIERMAKLTHLRCPDALFHTDAVQGFCKVPFRASTLGADAISISGHKIHASKGVGALYLAKRLAPLLLGGGQENGARSGTENLPGIASLAAACAAFDRQQIRRQEEMKQHLRLRLSALEGVTLLGAQDAPHIVNLAVAGVRSQGLINVLQDMGFCVSAGSACNKGHRSHVLEAMGVAPALIDGSIRVSLSAENTMQEMDDFADALPRAVAALR